MKHTKEPWYAIQNPEWENADYRISNKENDEWANFNQIAYANEANAKRIVACVNACAGMTNKALEAGVVACGVNKLRDNIPEGSDQFYFDNVKVFEEDV